MFQTDWYALIELGVHYLIFSYSMDDERLIKEAVRNFSCIRKVSNMLGEACGSSSSSHLHYKQKQAELLVTACSEPSSPSLCISDGVFSLEY